MVVKIPLSLCLLLEFTFIYYFQDFHSIFMAGGVKNINDPDHNKFIRLVCSFSNVYLHMSFVTLKRKLLRGIFHHLLSVCLVSMNLSLAHGLTLI